MNNMQMEMDQIEAVVFFSRCQQRLAQKFKVKTFNSLNLKALPQLALALPSAHSSQASPLL